MAVSKRETEFIFKQSDFSVLKNVYIFLVSACKISDLTGDKTGYKPETKYFK